MVKSSINPLLTLDYMIGEDEIKFSTENPHN